MTCAQLFTSVGLILGMAGVALIFAFGPPQPDLNEGVGLGLEDATPLSEGRTVAERNADVGRLKQQHSRWSKVGLILVFLGFLSQFVGAWV